MPRSRGMLSILLVVAALGSPGRPSRAHVSSGSNVLDHSPPQVHDNARTPSLFSLHRLPASPAFANAWHINGACVCLDAAPPLPCAIPL